ncbi:bifunctional acetate--CoA ligase family protein/GNAT family N-acetyltransferase [Nocardiopsis halotolerans]|uniref:bifunctional acetate--CoA ligase family protein/GNAT family N-acetyltransferase n=1 Tax=Nocardiopsis halotolerans TaxID=124252 RepID=UPI00034BAD22|nr:GNAT family N-acetyltransferase [Nocardiopsis halotolerans]
MTSRIDDEAVRTTDEGTSHALLSDGAIVLIRPARAEDVVRVRKLYEGMSQENLRMRFFLPSTSSARAASERACADGDTHRAALLAVLDGEVVGVASYDATEHPHTGELGLAVAEGAHGRGVGTLLLEHLASVARERGIRAFHADVLAANHEMLRVCDEAGLRSRRRTDAGVVELTLPLDQDDHYVDVVGRREEQASRESLKRLLRPRSAVVIGVTSRAVSIGNAILRSIACHGFTGPVYAVHPQAPSVADVSLPVHRSVAELPEPPDLAVVAVPPDAVVPVARSCGERGVGALVVVTSNLGPDTSRELLSVCRNNGMRLVGPNSFGVVCTEPGVNLQATFAARPPSPGGAGLVVQSGGVGISLFDHLSRLGVGVSSSLAVGSRLDVSSNDMLSWWEADGSTTMAVVHVESFGNPRKFSRLARGVGRRMPVLAVRTGRSEAGRRAALAHGGPSLPSVPAADALFDQAGVTAVSGVGELVATAALMAHQPLPRGPRVAVLTNTAGIGGMAADACHDAGLEIVELSERTRRGLEESLPDGALCANPVDTTPAARSDQLRTCLEALSAAPEVDAVMAITVPTALADPAPAVSAAVRDVPVVAVTPEQPESVAVIGSEGRCVPSYNGPEPAAAALGAAWRRASWLARPPGRIPALSGVASYRAAEIVNESLEFPSQGGWLPLHRVMELLACYGIVLAPWRHARTEEEALRAAAEISGPVALKADVAGIVHRGRADALCLGLTGEERFRNAYRALAERFRGRARDFLVQGMVSPGFEVLIGSVQQPDFGPVIVCGPGGSYAEALNSRTSRLTPLTDVDAAEMVRSVPELRRLGERDGERGVEPAVLEEPLLRFSKLVDDLPEIAEAEMNPVVTGSSSAVCVDARVRVARYPHGDPYLRALRPL